MRASRTVASAALALLALLLCAVRASPAENRTGSDRAAWRDLRFVSPEKLAFSRTEPRLSEQKARELADAWLGLLDPANGEIAAGAIDLLQAAPSSVTDAIASKLAGSNALELVVRESSNEARSRILNSPGMNLARLRDFAPTLYSSELEQALKSGNVALIASFSATARGFRQLPAEIVSKVANALDAGKLPDQARPELFSLLRVGQAEDLRPIESLLRQWLKSTSTNAQAVERRDAARALLLKLDVDLDEQEIKAALAASDPAQYDAAISYLQGRNGTPKLVTDLVKYVNARLLDEKERPEKWMAVYRLLKTKAPSNLAELYQAIQVDQLPKVWPEPSIAVEWLLGSPESVPSRAGPTLLKLYDRPNRLPSCDILRFRLALLKAMAASKQPTLDWFWQAVVAQPHECGLPLGSAVDSYLAEASKIESLPEKLPVFYKKYGTHVSGELQLKSALLSEGLARELERLLLAGDTAGAQKLVNMGVGPSVIRLEEGGYWSPTKLPKSAQSLELYFRAAQAAGAAPEFVISQAAKVAADDSLDAQARSYALMAIASTGHLVANQVVFNDALLSPNTQVARTAMLLMTRAYDGGLPKEVFKKPAMDGLADVLLRLDISSVSSDWLAALAPYDDEFAHLRVDRTKWAPSPSLDCWTLTEAMPLRTDSGVVMLNAVSDGPAGDELRACLGMLFPRNSPVSVLARSWSNGSSSHPEVTLAALRALRQDPAYALANRVVRAKMASLVATTLPHLPYTFSSQVELNWWQESLKTEDPGPASQIRDEYRKRVVVLLAVGIPGAVFIHLGLWMLLLVFYPSSPSLQAVVFWNPLVRKLLGLGYVDLVFLYVPFARRRLFAPFTEEFIRDAKDPDDAPARNAQSYFAESKVRHRPARVGVIEKKEPELLPITTALARPRGRVLLLGKSGLGKSTFLRHCLKRRTADVVVYLRADQCGKGVEAEISGRMKAIGSDLGLLKATIYAGRLWVYIDGYNEVDTDTQDAITSFVADYPHGNILIASQIPLRGFAGIETFELMPLERDQIQAFLVSRSMALPEDALVTGESYQNVASAFLDDMWAKPVSEQEAAAFKEILANPMDLTSVALLLSQGRVPDVFALEQQQFDAVSRSLARLDVQFRTLAFSKSILKQRLDDQEDLGMLPFKPEVTALIAAKLAQVRTFTDPAGVLKAQEVRFRHDRIRDFFTHFAFLGATPEEQIGYANDARFAGVFPYLARAMPTADAESLRERLITLAAHIEDHRVSDSFIREYSWRQRFESNDPDWMLAYDLPDARLADATYEDLTRAERETQELMRGLREKISAARRLTRILSETTPSHLVELATQMLSAMGAECTSEYAPGGLALLAPDGTEFFVVALAQADVIRQFHVDLLAARVQGTSSRLLVVTNWQVSLPPSERAPMLDVEAIRAFGPRQCRVISSLELYQHFQEFKATGVTSVWLHIFGHSVVPK